MSPYVALLRGINVGGKNSLPMNRLAGMLESLGCSSVRTYIQSGNVVFAASEVLARRVPRDLSDMIRKKTRLDVPVIVRSSDEFAGAARKNPFLAADVDPKTLHIAFLADVPTPARVAGLDPGRSPPDELVVVGREIYLCLPNGVGKTRFTNAYLDAKLGTVSTLRNLRTVEKLVRLCLG